MQGNLFITHLNCYATVSSEYETILDESIIQVVPLPGRLFHLDIRKVCNIPEYLLACGVIWLRP